MFGFGKPNCMRCNGRKVETYYADVPVGGASSRTRREERTRTCSACGGTGKAA